MLLENYRRIRTDNKRIRTLIVAIGCALQVFVIKAQGSEQLPDSLKDLPIFQNIAVEEVSGVVLNDDGNWVELTFPLELFRDFKVPSEPTSDLTLVQTDTILYERRPHRTTLIMHSYKTTNGKYLSFISKGIDNYIWFIPDIRQNRITGEVEIIPQVTNKIIGYKYLRDDIGLAFYEGELLYASLSNDAEYVIKVKYQEGKRFYFPFDKWCFGIINPVLFFNDLKASYAGVHYRKKHRGEEEELRFENIISANLYISKDDSIPLLLYEFQYAGSYEKGYAAQFKKNEEQCYLIYTPQVNQLNVALYLEPHYAIPLCIDDRIKSISIDGKIVTVTFEQPQDFLKYTLFSHGVFDGHLTRKTGYFTTKNDNPDRYMMVGQYHMTSPVTVEHRDHNDYGRKLGKITIPAGCFTEAIELNFDMMGDLNPNRMIFIDGKAVSSGKGINKNGFFIFDDRGDHTYTVQEADGRGVRIFYKDGDKIAAQLDAQKDNQIKKEEAAIIAQYNQRYGKSNVDAVLRGRLEIGMPWALVKEVFPYRVWDKSQYSTTYKVVNHEPIISRAEKRIKPMEIGYGQLVYVTVQNGKITDIYYTNRR